MTDIDFDKHRRMSFLFPAVFRDMLTDLKKKYNKDMTYIVMEAVNEWVIRKENITVQDGDKEHGSDNYYCQGNHTVGATTICNGGKED